MADPRPTKKRKSDELISSFVDTWVAALPVDKDSIPIIPPPSHPISAAFRELQRNVRAALEREDEESTGKESEDDDEYEDFDTAVATPSYKPDLEADRVAPFGVIPSVSTGSSSTKAKPNAGSSGSSSDRGKAHEEAAAVTPGGTKSLD